MSVNSSGGTERFACPVCDGDLYRGSHRGSSAYKCMSANRCDLSNTPIGRTKAEVRQVYRYLSTDTDRGEP